MYMYMYMCICIYVLFVTCQASLHTCILSCTSLITVYFVSEVHCTLYFKCTVPDIIKFTYCHCTSINYSGSEVHVHCMYFKCTTHYYTLVLHCMLSYAPYKCKGNSHITMITV